MLFSPREIGLSPGRKAILALLALLVYFAGLRFAHYCEQQKAKRPSMAASPAQQAARKQGRYILPVEITRGGKRPQGW